MRYSCLLAAIIASTAHAQEGSPIEVYGRVYVLLESVSAGGGADSPPTRARVSNQASMMGVRGIEWIAPGFGAWFQLETGFQPDAAGIPFANRNSAVGLQTPAGSIFAGRWDSTFEQSQVGIVDPFNDQGLPDITGAAVNQGNFARRQQNVVQYWSPVLGGMQVKLGYAANEGRTAAVNPYDYGASLAYRDDRAYLAIAYERHVDQAGAVAAAGIDETGWGVSGYRRFDCLKFYGQAGAYRRTGTLTQHSYLLGFEWNPLGAGCAATSFIASHQRSSGGGLVDVAQPECTLWGVGLRHSFSRRTFLIAEYARVDNRQGSLCNFGSNPLPIGDGQSLTGWGVGIRTLF